MQFIIVQYVVVASEVTKYKLSMFTSYSIINIGKYNMMLLISYLYSHKKLGVFRRCSQSSNNTLPPARLWVVDR